MEREYRELKDKEAEDLRKMLQLRNSNDELRSNLTNTEAQVQELAKGDSGFEATRKAYQEEMKKKPAKIEELRAEVKHKNQENFELNSELKLEEYKACHDEMNKKTVAIEELQTEVKHLKHEIKHLKQETFELNSELEDEQFSQGGFLNEDPAAATAALKECAKCRDLKKILGAVNRKVKNLEPMA